MFYKLLRSRLAYIVALSALSVQPAYSQWALLDGQSFSNLPVTNKLNIDHDIYGNPTYTDAASVYGITSYGSKYYILGDFTDLTTNLGGALILDTTTHSVLSQHRWNISGLVKTAVGDGNGGFYIGGSFTSIGDSAIAAIAHIDKNGFPLPFGLRPGGTVNTLLKRNDTLFIGGSNLSVNDWNTCFAMYSLSGDSLIPTPYVLPFYNMLSVNALLIKNDTVIAGGNGYSQQPGIQKFNFRNFKILPWNSQVLYQTYNSLSFNADSSVIVAAADYAGTTVLGLDYLSGTQRYSIAIGGLQQVAVAGNKGFAAGLFNYKGQNGIFSFDASTGAILADNFQLDGCPTFVAAMGNRLFISGKFSTVEGQAMENFAELDASTLAVRSWQLAPSDPLSTIAFSGADVFVSGIFNGIGSVHRNGFAAVDSATNQILSWNPAQSNYVGVKRMFARGDSLFVLGFTNLTSSCIVNDYSAALQIYSISTGNVLYSKSPLDDFTVDGSYAYVSANNALRRYHLPDMTVDPTWGTNWSGSGGDHTPTWLIVRGDSIYEVGDNRFSSPCTNLGPRMGYFISYDKATGTYHSIYTYEDSDPIYDVVAFEHGLLEGNKLYIQGYFNSLNGQTRPELACIDITNGALTSWKPALGNYTASSLPFGRTSQLKLFGNHLWFGSGLENVGGLTAIDTASGILLPASAIRFNQDGDTRLLYNAVSFNGVQDLIINDHGLLIVGAFDSVNSMARTSIAGYTVTVSDSSLYLCQTGTANLNTSLTGVSYQWQMNSGNGFVNIANDSNFSGVNTPSLAVKDISPVCTGNMLRCLVDAGSSPLYDLQITPSSVPGITILPAPTSFCMGAPATFVASAVHGGAQPIYTWLVDNSPTGFSGDTLRTTSLHDGDSINVVLQSSAACVLQPRDTSLAVSVAIHPNIPTSVNIAMTGDSCAGSLLSFTATGENLGSSPVYFWMKNGQIAGWAYTFSSSSLADGDSINLIALSSVSCATPSADTSNTIRAHVNPIVKPAISISGKTVFVPGSQTLLYANAINGGADPGYRWEDSSDFTGWQSISNASDSVLSYGPVSDSIFLRCVLTSDAACVESPTAYSNVLKLTVTRPATTSSPYIYPNPGLDELVIDNLSASSGFAEMTITATDGKLIFGPIPISGQTPIKQNVSTLAKGTYIVLLYRSDGSSIHLRFLKL